MARGEDVAEREEAVCQGFVGELEVGDGGCVGFWEGGKVRREAEEGGVGKGDVGSGKEGGWGRWEGQGNREEGCTYQNQCPSRLHLGGLPARGGTPRR